MDPSPQGGVQRRRRELREWGFGRCDCERCLQEEKELKEDKEHEGGEDEKGDVDGVDDLERELKAGLGIM